MNKLAVISGGTKGIGRALVELFHLNGFDVITCARNAKDLKAMESQLNQPDAFGSVTGIQADMSRKEEVQAFAADIRKLGRPVDVLINNTGVYRPGYIHDLSEDLLDWMLHTNLHSAYYLTRGVIEDMMKVRSGHIFNICSTASNTPFENGGSYSISKYAMLGMTKVLREEMKKHGVRVTAVLPGPTETASWEGAEVEENRLMRPEDIAKAIWSAYALSDNAVVEELTLRPQLGDL
ncbi:MAG: SDR family oxidoreductase [Cytophagales bacterium]|nr:SDR family oxidoreductase [Cytophagales bacterium]